MLNTMHKTVSVGWFGGFGYEVANQRHFSEAQILELHPDILRQFRYTDMDDDRVGPDHDIVVRENKGEPKQQPGFIPGTLKLGLEEHAIFADVDNEAKFRTRELAEVRIYFYRDVIETDAWISAAILF